MKSTDKEKVSRQGVSRRGFLKSAALGAAAITGADLLTGEAKATEDGYYLSFVTLRKGNRRKPYQSINTSYPIRKSWWLYLLLEKNLASASYTKALEFRNGKCFRKVT